MRDFDYVRATGSDHAIEALAARPGARPVAGGTDLLTLLKDGIEAPEALVDITGTGLGAVEHGPDGLTLGALATLSRVAADPAVRASHPLLVQAVESAASPQLRNMATIGGNLLQRTRCPYFRAETALPCNRRTPGSGCSAVDGEHRAAAIFGWTGHCVATHPSDPAVALSAADARVRVRSAGGERTLALDELLRLPGDTPDRETALDHAELITAVEVPALPAGSRSCYLKVRERASYEFALVSCAVVLGVDGRKRISQARIALGGVAARPWRLVEAERALVGVELTAVPVRAAVERSFAAAEALPGNAFKVEVGIRTAVRAVLTAGGAR
ncbi:Periplasmic aromatic aldehyde oxidoreductase, FAD binding subunit YagS [Actinokineospora spheciospongiae]|uniref:Periplasmic aromatic aldehyde oxidoreductase, FAD binding subunit YagS n=1 Tax=Actinokineospora spheciospongiae TaxID=909613 RepID=W7J062_9PSEU|nr:xanthine dehydrogenase family protein subunit M [Actinokineospora spheciospongiae]EWC62357.1 Periplasmic aromatic aldehyde oxidoreductase, FAD binding subunit YagS [Actinokineospora spheciospongiae]